MTCSKALVAVLEPTHTTHSCTSIAQPPQGDECMHPETPQEPPKKCKKMAHKPQKTLSFQDPFADPTPAMYTPDHSVNESEARDRLRASASHTDDIVPPSSPATTSTSSNLPASALSNSSLQLKAPIIDLGLLMPRLVKAPVSFSLPAKSKMSLTIAEQASKSTRPFLALKKISKSTTSIFGLSSSGVHSQTPNSLESQALLSSLPSSLCLALPNTSEDLICPPISSNNEPKSTLPPEHPVQTIAMSPHISPPTISSKLPTTVKTLSKSLKNIPRAVTNTLLSLESKVMVLQEDQEALQIKTIS